MASGSESVQALREVLENSPGHLPTYARIVREAGLWPQASRGGGKRSPHVYPHHLANLLISLGGHLPSDGVKALELLRDLSKPGIPDDAGGPPGGRSAMAVERERQKPLTLHARLVWLIEQAADDPGFLDREFIGRWASWELALCCSPAFAEERTIITPEGDPGARWEIKVERYGAQEQPSFLKPELMRHVKRVVFLPPAAIVTAANLWRDTKARDSEWSSTASFSTANTEAVETKNASSPGRDEASIRDLQPASKQAATVSDSRRGRDILQSRFGVSAGHGLQGRFPNDPSSTDTASV